ncbi:Testicular acid phosphatase-like protein [Aphelenchoides fujianensis]|nr:Testicular acid phosphatase-like protein [Aphelenchoides fujianensis]
MPSIKLLLLFVVLASSSVGVEAKKRLVFVQAIWRHGDRAPSSLPYPNDENTERYWPRGWAQLTNEGMRQVEKLGEFFRDRYADSFVDEHFNVSQVYIRSSDSDRALVSAQAFMHGFFPPDKKERFDDDLKWQPLPIHSSGPGKDPLLRPTDYDCPAYDQHLEEFKKPIVDQLTAKYADFLSSPSVIGNPAGQLSVEEAAGLDDLSREIAHDLEQPDWVTREWAQYDGNTSLEIVMELQRVLRNAEFGDFKLAFLRGGLLLNDWTARAERVVRGNQSHPTHMNLYSSHDGTLLALLHNLQLADGQLVPYAACVIMEIYEDNGQHFVQFLYRHEEKTSQLSVRNCEEECPLDEFYCHSSWVDKNEVPTAR